jgi:hypothetical protein
MLAHLKASILFPTQPRSIYITPPHPVLISISIQLHLSSTSSDSIPTSNCSFVDGSIVTFERINDYKFVHKICEKYVEKHISSHIQLAIDHSERIQIEFYLKSTHRQIDTNEQINKSNVHNSNHQSCRSLSLQNGDIIVCSVPYEIWTRAAKAQPETNEHC